MLFKAGDQVPLIPLLDVVGNADKLPPEHIAGTAVKVGIIGELTVIVTSSKQDKSEAVHRKTFVPKDKPVTPEVGLFAFAKVADPLVTDHVPVTGKTAAKVVFVTLQSV